MPRTSDVANSQAQASHLLPDRFRCPIDITPLVVRGDLSPSSGYFRLGPDTVCYGQCSSGVPARTLSGYVYDVSHQVAINETSVSLPFDPIQVIDNLRCERYAPPRLRAKAFMPAGFLQSIYYALRPALGVSMRRHIQKFYFRGWDKIPFPQWPVDRTVETLCERLLAFTMMSRGIERLPFIWFWPEGAPSCTMMTHDVETSAGLDFCPQLMDLNDSFGIKSSFHIVPESRYRIPQPALENIRKRGFEINVHDLNHDGLLLCNQEEFFRRAQRINLYGQQFGAQGFRSAVMYRNTDWYDALDFSYDMSIPNMAHLDPQQGGCCTVLPFFIGKMLELPLTTTQDYSLFNILNDYSIRLWKQQVSLIREKHGLISFIIHPDYNIDQAPRQVYKQLLQYLSDLRSLRETWIALPGEVAAWWRQRSQLKLVKVGKSWRIQGQGNERARLAWTVLDDNRLSYVIDRGQGGDVTLQKALIETGKDFGNSQETIL